MFSQRVRQVMERERLITAPPQTTVIEAARLMAASNVGAVVVVEGGVLAGIFTERDAVFRVIARGLDTSSTPLAQVMTPSPMTIAPDRPFGVALQLMHQNGFRHVPVLEGGKIIGIVTSRDAMDPEMEEFVCEALRREGMR